MTKQFQDFTRVENFDVLMREFQEQQKNTELAAIEMNKAEQIYRQQREYFALCTEYQNLYGNMMHKLLDASTAAEINKIRDGFKNKLTPLLQKIRVIQAKIEGEIAPETIVSRNGVMQHINKLQGLLNQANEIKKEIEKPTVAPIILADVIPST